MSFRINSLMRFFFYRLFPLRAQLAGASWSSWWRFRSCRGRKGQWWRVSWRKSRAGSWTRSCRRLRFFFCRSFPLSRLFILEKVSFVDKSSSCSSSYEQDANHPKIRASLPRTINILYWLLRSIESSFFVILDDETWTLELPSMEENNHKFGRKLSLMSSGSTDSKSWDKSLYSSADSSNLSANFGRSRNFWNSLKVKLKLFKGSFSSITRLPPL